MKIASIQPKYPYTPQEMPALIAWIEAALDACDTSLDLIVLPEACNAMSSYPSVPDFYADVERYGAQLQKKASETARRCGAALAINLYTGENGVYRNTTQLYDRNGALAGEYFKQQLPESESVDKHIDGSYAMTYHPAYTLDLDGVRYGFLTCYDCYYNEYIQHLALRRPDVVIVCSLQRGETMHMLATEMKNIAFNCNAFVVRSSVSMGGADFPNGASTMIVAPNGDILDTLGQQIGMLTHEIDPHRKHERPDTFGKPPIRNERFIEKGRTPWAYRACGPSVIPGDAQQPYPRLCAHRGFNTVLPENTLPAFAAAVSLGAVEIELDLWPSKDGELIVCHDATVDRMSDGSGAISDLTWDEIRALDVGAKKDAALTGLSFPLLEDVLRTLARQTIVNLHIKTPRGSKVYDEAVFQKIVDTIYAYDMHEHVYIAGAEDVLVTACKLAPELPRAALDEKRDFTLVKLAKAYHCRKLQLFRGYYTQDMIDEAHAAGIRCNLFWSDDPAEIPALLQSGVDTILTNDYLRMSVAFHRAVQK